MNNDKSDLYREFDIVCYKLKILAKEKGVDLSRILLVGAPKETESKMDKFI